MMVFVKVKFTVVIASIFILVLGTQSWANENDWGKNNCLVGNSIDRGRAIAVDSAGNAFIVGHTESADFPTSEGAYDTTYNGLSDVFVVKLNPAGSALSFSTYIGGEDNEQGYDVAVDGAGNAYITGFTVSSDFPTTSSSYDSTLDGERDAFVVKLSAGGDRLIYASFLGGSNSDGGLPPGAIAVDGAGNVYVTGFTESSDFPTTAGAFDRTCNNIYPYPPEDIFVTKFNALGTDLEYSTFLGGRFEEFGYGIAVDNSGCAYVTGYTASNFFPTTAGAFDRTYNGEVHGGQYPHDSIYGDAFLTKFNPTGSALEYSTYFGAERWDYGRSIAIDGAGNAYITGYTNSRNFPTTMGAFDSTHNGRFDAFGAKFNLNDSTLDYSTYIGAVDIEASYGIAVDGLGHAYIIGETQSVDFPTTPGVLDPDYNGQKDIFIVRINSTGSDLDYATYFGGLDHEVGIGIAVDDTGSAYMTGYTMSDDFPVTAGAFDTTFHGYESAFVLKLNATGSVLDYATFIGGDSIASSVPVMTETPPNKLPKTYVLNQNYPNPFNASTEIQYQIPKDGHLTLKVFDTLGQEVRTLVDTKQEAGLHTISWNGRDSMGQEVASGVYFCRLKAGEFEKTTKMLLLR